MSTILSAAEIQSALGELPGWSRAGDTLAKTYQFKSFREAMSFMVRVAFEAEALNHHPDWSNVYNRVDVKLSTHDAGGKVTAKDVELAKRFEKVAWVSRA
jgi:4a-hydroxytetrahydrobiopterin dehydratase